MHVSSTQVRNTFDLSSMANKFLFRLTLSHGKSPGTFSNVLTIPQNNTQSTLVHETDTNQA